MGRLPTAPASLRVLASLLLLAVLVITTNGGVRPVSQPAPVAAQEAIVPRTQQEWINTLVVEFGRRLGAGHVEGVNILLGGFQNCLEGSARSDAANLNARTAEFCLRVILIGFEGTEDPTDRVEVLRPLLEEALALADERARPLHPADEAFAAGAIDAFKAEMEAGLLDLPVPEMADEATEVLLGALVDSYSGCLIGALRSYGSGVQVERASAGTTNSLPLGERLAQHCREAVLAQLQELARRAACLAPQPDADAAGASGEQEGAGQPMEECPEAPPLPPPALEEQPAATRTPAPTPAPTPTLTPSPSPTPSPTAAPSPSAPLKVSLTTDKAVYQVGDAITICWSVPVSGTVRLINRQPGLPPKLIGEFATAGPNCIHGIVDPPAGRECIRMEFTSFAGNASPEVCFEVRGAAQPSPAATAGAPGACRSGWSGTWYDRRNSGQPWWPDLVLSFSGTNVTGKFGSDTFTGTLTGDTVHGTAWNYKLEIRLGWGGDNSGKLYGPLGCINIAVKVDNHKWSLYELRHR